MLIFMALVIKPEKNDEIYLKAVIDKLREYGVKSFQLPQDISFTVGNTSFTLLKGSYVIPYKNNKPRVVEAVGIELRKKGFKVYSLDPFTIALFHLLDH